MHASESPRSPFPLIIGIVCAVMSVGGICCGPGFIAAGAFTAQTAPDGLTSAEPLPAILEGCSWFLQGVLLLAASLGLLRYRDWGRLAFYAYGGMALLATLVKAGWGLLAPAFQRGLDPGAALGGMLNALLLSALLMLFPVAGVLVLNRPNVRRDLQ